MPQLLDQTADTLWGDHLDPTIAMGASGTAGYGSGGGYGYGSGSGRLGGMHRATAPVYDTASDLLAVGNLAAVAEAQGAEEGALFVYTMPSPLALAAHESALVPFLSQTVEAAPITRVQASDPSSPRTAVRFVNTTSQTLPAGPIAFFAGGGFAGESALDRLAPKERRFIEFGQDLDVEVTNEPTKSSQKIARISFEQQLLEHYVRTTVTPWTFENRSAEPRELHLVVALGKNAKLTGGDGVDFDVEQGRAIVVVKVPPRTIAKRTITSEEGLAHPTSLDRIASKRLAELAALPDLPAADRALALEGEARARELEQTRAAATSTKEEIVRVEAELERLRANAKALTGPGATAQPLVTRMLAAEDRLAKLNDKLRDLEAEAPKRTEALRMALAKWRP